MSFYGHIFGLFCFSIEFWFASPFLDFGMISLLGVALVSSKTLPLHGVVFLALKHSSLDGVLLLAFSPFSLDWLLLVAYVPFSLKRVLLVTNGPFSLDGWFFSRSWFVLGQGVFGSFYPLIIRWGGFDGMTFVLGWNGFLGKPFALGWGAFGNMGWEEISLVEPSPICLGFV
jgi:hypothetical protein